MLFFAKKHPTVRPTTLGYLKTKKKSRRYAPKKREKKTEKSTKVLKGKELLKSPRRQTNNTKPDTDVAEVRGVVEAIGRSAVLRRDVPRATAQQPVSPFIAR
jgi:hypothetical protein